jgi:hypothetical protein
MIIVKLKGGLGNQMFQYAAGRVLASNNKQALLIDTGKYTENYHTDLGLLKLKISDDTRPATESEIKSVKNPYGLFSEILSFIDQKMFRNFYVDEHLSMLKFKKDSHYLEGYFQSEKNFIEIRPLLLEELSLKKEYVSTEVQKMSQEIYENNSISVHIRRGDYSNNTKTSLYHGLCSVEYYQSSIDFISGKVENPVFYIFSDSTEWVKNNLNLPENSTIVSDNGFSAEQDLYLMSQCKHNIIANSSFSWWGAWLNTNPEKIIIAPKNWLRNGDGPHKNIIPKSWIRI